MEDNKVNKIKSFEVIPTDSLTKVGGTEKAGTLRSDNISVDNDFFQTNLHTKHTGNFNDNDTNSSNPTNNTDTSTEQTTITTEKKNRLGKLMQGGFAVELVDMIIPTLVVLLVGYIGYELEKKDLQLTKSEKEALAPAVQDVLDEINIDFNNPYMNLTIMIGIVYGSKIADKLPTLKKKKKVVQDNRRLSDKMNDLIKDSAIKQEATEVLENTLPQNELDFEVAYNKMVDETRTARRRGIDEAKTYLALNKSDQLRTLLKIHNLHNTPVADRVLNFSYIPASRGKYKKKDKPNFTLD